jgi:hypothetical protein
MARVAKRITAAWFAQPGISRQPLFTPTSSYLATLAIVLSSLTGCGFTPNSNAASTVNQGSSGSGSGVSTGTGQTVPLPGQVQALTGCANPNTGTPSNDWGVGTDPVYTTVSNTTPVVGTPVYHSNAIFWTSRETSPGQSILLTGAFTDSPKQVRLAVIPDGTIDWQTVVRGSSTVVSPTQQGTTGLSFIVPKSFPAGVYGFQIEDASTAPVLDVANQPSLNWAIGIPASEDASQALQHQVYDCGVEAGGILRIFGKNFVPSHQVVLQSSSGVAYSLMPSKLDSNSIAVTIPATILPGTYNLWVGGSPWGFTSSPAAQVAVFSPPSWKVVHYACPGLVGDGVTDNTKALQSCLDGFAPIAGSRVLTYLDIPSGNFVLTGGVTAHSFEVLDGTSAAATQFLGRPAGMPPQVWFNVSQYSGMVNLSMQAPANPNLLLSSGSTAGNPLTCGHLFFANVKFASTTDASNGAEVMFAIAGPDIQVYNSTFFSSSNQVFDISYGDGGIASGNQMIVNNFTGLGISDSQNIIFENNLVDSQNTPGQGNGGHSGGSGLSISRGNNQYGPSALSRDIYVGYNSFTHMGSADQQVITNDGDGGAYFGPIASSSATTVTLADDPAWNWMGTTNPGAAVMAISFGTGLGQYSFLQSYSGRSINLDNPWKVTPDATSVVGIFQYELNMTIAHNTITNTLGDAIVLADALEGVVEDNVLTNAGGGILISAFGPYGGPAAYGPVMDTDILRNTIALGAGTMISQDANPFLWGIGIQDFPGCLLSGLMIRDNIVPSVNVIYSTDGVNGISSNVIEQNVANWQPAFNTPGFLVQDNSPPTT